MRVNKTRDAVANAIVTKNGTRAVVPAMLVEFDSTVSRDAAVEFANSLKTKNPGILKIKTGERFAEQSGTYGFQQTSDRFHKRKAKS